MLGEKGTTKSLLCHMSKTLETLVTSIATSMGKGHGVSITTDLDILRRSPGRSMQNQPPGHLDNLQMERAFKSRAPPTIKPLQTRMKTTQKMLLSNSARSKLSTSTNYLIHHCPNPVQIKEVVIVLQPIRLPFLLLSMLQIIKKICGLSTLGRRTT